MSEDDRLMNVDEVANFLAVSKGWVYQACADKTIPHIKVGGFTRFRKPQLEEWLDSREVSPVERQRARRRP
jgi:excisionase family DNA binding protein